MKMNLQMFGGRGGGSGLSSGGGSAPAVNNSFESKYGLPNVGTREGVTSIGGFGTRGTVTPNIDDVQEYFDTGRFDNYGTNARAKSMIASEIARDMNGRGFEMQVSEDKVHLLPDGETGLAISIGRSGDKWKAKASMSAGTKRRGGMKGALDRASERRR